MFVFYPTNATLVCDLSNISSAVFWDLGTDISATVQPIEAKVCVIVKLRPGTVFSPVGGDIFMSL